MQLRIENIGPVGSAVIDLTGLTIIGGLNDSGKSTIGKCLFSIVKAVRNIDDESIAEQNNRIGTLVSELISELRKAAGPRISPTVFNHLLRRLRDVRRFRGDGGIEVFDVFSVALKNDVLEEVVGRTTSSIMMKRSVDGKITRETNVEREETRQKIREVCADLLDAYFARVRKILTDKQDPKAIYSSSFRNILSGIFREEINNKRQHGKGTIKLSDNGQEVISAAFRKNILLEKELKIEDTAIEVLFEDATLIESPFMLNFEEDLIMTARSNSGQYSGSYSTYDLMEKLNFASKDVEPATTLDSEIAGKISQKINGRMYYEPEGDTFTFSSSDGINFKIPNTASGVKTLGILQMLARAGVLTTSNLLIIDEPEVHLHPAWQILYAEIVAILVKNNVYCVVSSHSPYFIQALQSYSKIYKIDKLTKFYISNKGEGVCNFKDVTSDPEPLYKLLADPMREIAYLRSSEDDEDE